VGEALERLFAIALCFGIAIFCFSDAHRNVRQGYYPNPSYWIGSARRGARIMRQEYPKDFWSCVALKFVCGGIALTFGAVVLGIALTH
jgi:hypothetical protein